MSATDRSAIISTLRTQVATTPEGAYYTGGPMPDPALAEIFPAVKEALDAFEALQAEATKLCADLKEARALRAKHKDHEEAVYTSDPGLGLVFSDPEGVRLQNRVRQIEKAIGVITSKAKKALLNYLVEAFTHLPEARGTFLQRAKDADTEVQELASSFLEALAKRERYWSLAGQPVPGASPEVLPVLQAARFAEQDQLKRDLKNLVDRVLPFPNL